MFRTKNRKPTSGDNRVTVDAKHNEMLKHFEEQRKKLPEKYKELETFETEYKGLKKFPNKDLNNEELSRKFFLSDKISALKEEIDKIENNRDELKYFMNTGHLLYDYYENIQNISKTKTIPSSNLNYLSRSPESNIETSNSITIQESKSQSYSGKCEKTPVNSPEKGFASTFLSESSPSCVCSEIKKAKKKEPKSKTNIMQFLSAGTGHSPPNKEMAKNIDASINDPDKKENKKNKGECLSEGFQRSKYRDQFLKIIDPNFVIKIDCDPDDYNLCDECGCEKNIVPSEGIMVCENCGLTDLIVIDSERPSYREPPPEVSYFAYKRMNHFNELLNQTQGKETTEIPQNVIDEIWMEIKKNRIKNLSDLTPVKIRSYLKKLGHSKYYEHASYILYRINGKKPPTISPEIEEKLKRMFREIQEPFTKVCPKGRKNFLSYSYIFHKFVELLGHDELKELFPLLKSRDKLHQQDIIWEGICKELRLHFIPSV